MTKSTTNLFAPLWFLALAVAFAEHHTVCSTHSYNHTQKDSMLPHTRRITTGITNTDVSQQAYSPAIQEPDHHIERGIHIGGIYLHRNGNQYKVLSVACNTEDLS